MSGPNPKLTRQIIADHAEKALEAHAESVGVDYSQSQEALTDLLTSLRHYADEHGLSFWKSVSASESHHLAEAK
jgi:ABC-type uncharacterized transport system substrate-binding protein